MRRDHGGRARPRRCPSIVPGLAALVLAGAGAGCTFFPAQGPSSLATHGTSRSAPTSWSSSRADATDATDTSDASPDRVPYRVVDLTPAVVARLREAAAPNLRQVFGDQRPAPQIRLGVGDVVGVTIFEAAAGGLFIPSEAGTRAGNFVVLPNQEIDQNGLIAVPYAGRVAAAGRTPAQVKSLIEERLRNRAIEPQAVVTLQEGRSSQVSVTGEVNASVRFTLSKAGERVLDAIARAGGPRYPAYETYVTLKRGGRTAKAYLNAIVAEGANDLYLRPGDTLVLDRQFRSFMALGASGQTGQIPFDAETLTLAQAVGRSGGVLDARGDPGQVHLYRLEAPAFARALGVAPDADPGGRSVRTDGEGEPVPVIYRVNLREPDGFFLAGRLPMRDGDILFVPNSGASEFGKVLSLLQLGGGAAADVNPGRIVAAGARL